MGNKSGARKTLSAFTFLCALSLNNTAYASNDGQLCDGIGILACIPLALVMAISPNTIETPASKIQTAIHKANLRGFKKALNEYPNALAPCDLLRAVINQYESGKKQEKSLEILTFLLKQKIDVNTTDYSLLDAELINDFYGASSNTNKRKLTLRATELVIEAGFIFPEQKVDPREYYAARMQSFSPNDMALEDEFYKLIISHTSTPATLKH